MPIETFRARVRNGRLVLDEPTYLPEGSELELVAAKDIVDNGGSLLDATDRAALDQKLPEPLEPAAPSEVIE